MAFALTVKIVGDSVSTRAANDNYLGKFLMADTYAVYPRMSNLDGMNGASSRWCCKNVPRSESSDESLLKRRPIQVALKPSTCLSFPNCRHILVA